VNYLAQFRWVILFLALDILFGSTEDIVQSHLEKGKVEAEQGNFKIALNHFNNAMGYLRQSSNDNLLIEEVEKQIRITKGRSLVSRLKIRSGGFNSIGKNTLLPIREESEDIIVSQCFGTVLVRGIWHARNIERKNEIFGFGRRVTTLPSAGVELSIKKESKYVVRSVEAASFAIDKKQTFDFHSGSFSLHTLESNNQCTIKSPLSEIVLESSEPFAIMLAVTTNGGLKIIGLLGKIDLKQNQKPPIFLRPGELVFSLPDGFSRKMNVELSTLMVTSKLMTAFDEPPVFFKKLKQQALIQALKTKKRFRTIVGDAKTNSDFQIKVLNEE
jgi:hypothetical protein